MDNEIKTIVRSLATVSEKKTFLQKNAVDTWLKSGGNGVITAFTGFGKTTLVLMAIERYLKKFPNEKVAIILPSEILRFDWQENVNDRKLQNSVQLFVINTYTLKESEKRKVFGLLVVDEVHHILNKESKYFSNVLSMTDRQYFLGVSATLEEKHVKFLNDSGCGVNYEITLKDGVDLGIIPEFIIYNLGIDLDAKSKNAFIKVNKLSKELYSYFKTVAPTNTFELIMQCTSKDNPFKEIYVQGRKKILQNVLVNGVVESTIKYAIIAETYYGMGEDFINIVASTNNIEEKSVISYANMWLRNMRTKNKICNDNPNRVKVITEFLKTNQVPTIVFNPSKEYSKMLFNESKGNSIEYHSGVTKSKRLKILPAFEEGLFKNLLCIKSLDEGANINSLELALNLGFDSLSLKLVQRIGRLLRYNPNKPDVTKCFINIHTNSFEYEDEDTFETVVEIPPDYKRLVKSQKNISGIEILTNINDVRSIDKGG